MIKTWPVSEENQVSGELIGIFLVGAYQEILGDNHNLLACTDAVDIDIDESGRVRIGNVNSGDSIASVLEEVNYNREEILSYLKNSMEESDLSHDKAKEIGETIASYFNSYTYLNL